MFNPTTSYDVAVLGGGLCGFAAARALARAGARVALVERRPVLGWEATSAFHLGLGEPTCETAHWLREAMTAAGGCRDGTLDAAIAEIVLDKAATDSGIDVLLYAQPVGVSLLRRDGRLTAVLLGTKSGELAVRARAFIDATENALLWRLAGGVVVGAGPRACPSAESGRAQGPAPTWSARQTLFLNGAKGRAAGEAFSPGTLAGCPGVVLRPGVWPGEVAVEFGIEACDIRLARQALPGLLRELRESVEGLANALVTSVGIEPYPLAAARQRADVGFRHPVAANLFGAAPWVMPAEVAREEEGTRSVQDTASRRGAAGRAGEEGWSLDRRLRLGEFAADAAAMVLGSLPEPLADDPLPHSQVAPPAHDADVVVCGGGTGGALAAIASARHGASTILLEASTGLGGIGTGGGIHIYYHGVAGGLQDEVDKRVDELSRVFGPAQGFHPEAKKVVLEQMALEAGVGLVYETTITGAQTETSRVPRPLEGRGMPRPDLGVPGRTLKQDLERGTPVNEGESRVPRPSSDLGVPGRTLKQDLERGTPVNEGESRVPRPSSDLGVPGRTLKQELERGTHGERRLTAVVAAGPEGNALYRGKAFVDATGDGDVAAMAGAAFTFGRAADGLPHAYSLAAGRVGSDGKLAVTNFDAGYCDPTDVVDLTRARRHALGHYRRERYEAANRLVYIAPILGLRNSRQVVGDYRLSLADEIAGREFPDVVAYAYSHFDNHGFDYENESDEAMLWVWLLGNWDRRIGCEIPYRTLLPAGVEGLLMGCRALSLTHDAHNQLRMQRDLQRIGEVAGIAAALAARAGLTPRELPIADLQAALLASGALGPRERPALPHAAPAASPAGTPKQGLGVAPPEMTAPPEITGRVPRPNSFGRAGDASASPESPDAAPPAAVQAQLHDASWRPASLPALPLAERIAQLGTEKTQEAAFDLIRRCVAPSGTPPPTPPPEGFTPSGGYAGESSEYPPEGVKPSGGKSTSEPLVATRGEEALPLLLQAVRSEKPAARFWASVALAMAGRSEAGPELRACLAERRAEAPEGRKTGPLWRSAMVLLGRIGDHEAVPELCRVLGDRSADLDALIAAVRALGRIGDAAAIPALEVLVERTDLPTQRQLQVSVAAANPVVEDARWQLDLAVAEALARLGKPRPDLAERHARDDRALVRRYARRVADLCSKEAGG